MKKTILPSLAGEISDLNIVFDKQPIISDISVNLYKNQIHMLTGASGSGKTTLLRALNRLNDCFDNCYTQGDITLSLSGKSLSVNNLKTHQLPDLRRKVGMVFQHPQLLPGTILENLLLPLSVVCHLKGEAAQERATTALTQAALWGEVKDRLDMSACSLSGGQQQRLCLARTLALEPEILLLDEPTASLDPETTTQVETLIRQLATQYTIVMVSHSALQTENLADQVIHLEQGRLA
ncbi:phosphate ABC transporter ATP-binding protein [Photobacterium chitinilyticum]|uniref:ATP-binding cassette domain-containing protein n=1 Tax=Photobacterium chitinilyticum TaxID=2485123 RepID=A0A444JWP6_9GAMM|nr:ATP-binding cassette domain-containing protein [Photobacterium chitinilyticum]RWX57490.1 ATP-binding cassette domain-containing protein [Photobacterium chitinilyticum]